MADMPTVPVDLARIIMRETSEEQVIVLKEKNGERAFPIMIGLWEALAIRRYIGEHQNPRPMTHDLLGNVIDALGFKLEKIIVTELKKQVFYAKLVLKRDSKHIEIDARPSDAVALASKTKCPIFVDESVFEEVLKNQIPFPFQQEPDEEEEPPEDQEEV
jgi:bifunctional DNase/RNase